MHVRDAILSRRTIQRYTTDPIPDGCIERGLRCALRAPNHKLSNPWRFWRVGPETRAQIVEVGVGLKRAKAARQGRQFSATREDKLRHKLGDSPAVIVVAQVLADDPFRRREDYGACACAIQNFMLSLWAEGVGSKWATGGVTRDPKTYDIIGADADTHEIIGFVWVGHPRRDPVETPRRALEDVYRELP